MKQNYFVEHQYKIQFKYETYTEIEKTVVRRTWSVDHK